MALTRPILISPIPAFDATEGYTFTFAVGAGSDQIVANRLTIRNNETNEVVYDEKQETYKYEHVVNANELTNGTYYNATLTVFNNADDESAASSPIQFWCYTTPTIQFTNWPTGNIVQNASFTFEFEYSQNEYERLNSYIVNLYNSFGQLVSTSNNIYVEDGTPPLDFSYTFNGFENNSIYYIEITGQTVEGTEITTDRQEFTVTYVRPDVFTLIELTNNCNEGYITIRSNIVLIEGTSNPDPPEYVDNNTAVDLTGEGEWVRWDEGYSISGNFLSRVWVKKPTPYTEILCLENESGQTISVKFMIGYENEQSDTMQAYLETYVESAIDMPYYIYSNFIDQLADTEFYHIWLRRVNNIYEIKLAKAT